MGTKTFITEWNTADIGSGASKSICKPETSINKPESTTAELVKIYAMLIECCTEIGLVVLYR